MKGKVHSRNAGGFTLIELLVVVTIIAILSAMTVGLGALVYRKLEVKRAYRDLYNIQLAIEAFYTEYGHYPPCNRFGHQPTDWNPDDTVDQSDGNPVFIPPALRNHGDMIGLEAYIFSKTGKKSLVGGDAASFYASYPDKAEKWASYLVDIPIGDYSANTVTQNVPGAGNSTMDFFGFVIVDPWMEQSAVTSGEPRYRYWSNPPYQAYTLGCSGPDGIDGTSDDFYLIKEGGKHSYEKK